MFISCIHKSNAARIWRVWLIKDLNCLWCHCMFQIQIHNDATKFVKLSVSLVSALIEQGMFYWFGGEMLEEVGELVLLVSSAGNRYVHDCITVFLWKLSIFWIKYNNSNGHVQYFGGCLCHQVQGKKFLTCFRVQWWVQLYLTPSMLET
jgi:hypothetical protein